MYLFERTEDKNIVNVYAAEIDKHSAYEYKENYLSTHQPTITLLTSEDIVSPDQNIFNYESFSQNGKYFEFELFKNKASKQEDKKVVNDYLEGKYDYSVVKIVYNFPLDKNIKTTLYLLYTEEPFIKGKLYQTNNIVLLNRELYLLKLLETNRLRFLSGEDLEFLRGIVSISESPINQINMDELRKMVDYGMLPLTYSGKANNVIASTDNLVRTLKK